MKRAALDVFSVLILSAFASASVIYSFTGTYQGDGGQLMGPVSFTLTVPTGVTADTTFSPSPQLVCDACDQINFYVDAVAHGFTSTPSNAIGYGLPGGTGYIFYFDPSSFVANGTYTDVIGSWFPNQGTLTVSGAASPSPEPGTILMLGSGLLGVASLARRKFNL
jgi:hypothetical protein